MTQQASTAKAPQSDPRSQQPQNFLHGLRLDHGPVPLLARFMLKSDHYMRSCGISLSFDKISSIADRNSEEYSNWGRFAPAIGYSFG